jgi:hypothetical protein
MPRSKRPRKAYRPGPVHANACERAIFGAERVQRQQVAELHQRRQQALQSLMQGATGGPAAAAWRELADAGNMAETLASMGLGCGEQARSVIEAAQAALADLLRRHGKSGRWTMRAQEIEALRWLLDLHQVQVAAASYTEYEQATQRTAQRVQQAVRGNAGASTAVLGGHLADAGATL